MKAAISACLLLGVVGATAGADQPQYSFSVLASGLHRPTGIAVKGESLYYTEVPTPGVGGGNNGVFKLNLENGTRTTLHIGEPEPTNLSIGKDGDVYWTCKSAGVILRQSADGTSTAPVLTGLHFPSGVAVSAWDDLYFTEVPTPGVAGGSNRVSVFDGHTVSVLHMGEPEPTDIVVDKDGDLYWTCKSAGVILQQKSGQTSVLVSGLAKPTGIALDRRGQLYWTEVPTPGVSGSAGGRNKVSSIDLASHSISVIHSGDPEPTDIAVSKNGKHVYWTCSSAGVIVEARRNHGRD